MRFSTFLGLTSLLLAGDGLATDSIDICPIENAATCGCPSNPSKRFVVPGRVSADRLFRRTGEACSDGKPACCTEKGPGPLEVSPGTSQTDLQCGTKFGDDNLDVTNGVVYNIEECPATGLYAGQSCLHVVLSPAPGVIVKDIHLQVDDSLITVNTKLGTWAFNKYCTTAPSECWVPVDAIKATFGSPPDSLCDKAIYVAAGISVSDTVSAATCFNKGTTIGSGNWFMYFTLKLECPEVCLHQCCCPPPPPPPSKSCTVGTAFGYGDGFINLNGKPVGPALGGTGCNRWGWYFTPSKASLQDGISGDLIVGAGGNDVSKGIYVGTWTAKLEASQITFEYTLFDDNDKGHFDLAEVHVYASCNKPPTCAPGQYTYTSPAGDLTGDSDTSIRKSIDVDGSCSSYYLIFHATVNELVPESEACGGAVE